MTTVVRYYKCGCAPDEDLYCKEADKRVWEARNAMNRWVLDEHMAAEHNEAIEGQIARADRWLSEHFRAQNAAGAYEDVDLDAPEMQPPAELDDYDPADLV